MKKVFIVLIVGLLLATGASYFGLQWKVDKAVSNLMNQLSPFIDADYDNVKVGLDGRISINKLNFYEANTATSVRIQSIGLATSGLLETIRLEDTFKSGKLPHTLKVDIKGLDFDIPRAAFSQLDAVMPSNTLSQMAALGCGQIQSIGPMQLYDLGLNSLVLDIEVGYVYEMALDEFVTTTSMSIDGMGAIESEQTILGLLDVMNNYQSAMFLDVGNITTQNTRLSMRDFGYNNKLVEYCAKKAKLTNDEWRELHTNMVVTALNQIELSSAFELKETYAKIMQPGIELEVSLRPLPDFELSQLAYYGVPDLISLSNLQFNVNNEALDLTGLDFNKDAFDNLNLKAVRLAHNVSLASDNKTTSSAANVVKVDRLIKVPPVNLSSHINRKALIERNDGQKFIGTISAVRNNQVQLRIRLGSGYTDLAIDIPRIKDARIYADS
ncbi:hypothetical protein QWZ13_12870 [Reinekea marina]|uniref:AsmA-like protein n=1 Tax=Reinekea marina TaxID=1310421 RepID=A0ABV7WVC0_9GAMM|nr:hypothetical protein [Reinekea marina]MDN3649805.1 hypothetical protein [Reinekea marina]